MAEIPTPVHRLLLTKIVIGRKVMFYLGMGLLVLCCWVVRVVLLSPPITDWRERGLRDFNQLCCGVKEGMTPEQVILAVGLPDNTDREHVWVWLAEWGRASEIQSHSWRRLIREPGFFTLFVDGKVAAPFIHKTVAGDPWEVYMGWARQAGKDHSKLAAEAFLGPMDMVE